MSEAEASPLTFYPRRDEADLDVVDAFDEMLEEEETRLEEIRAGAGVIEPAILAEARALVYSPPTDEFGIALHEARNLVYGRSPSHPTIYSELDKREFWTEEIRERLRSDQDAIILVWGPAGSGKSSAVLNLCDWIDPTFAPAIVKNPESRIAVRPWQVGRLFLDPQPYTAAFIDEAGSAGLLSTATFEPNQKDLVELIQSIRAYNMVVFVNIPHPADLAKSWRARRADYRLEVQRHSPESRSAFFGRRKQGRQFFLEDTSWLGFSDDDKGRSEITWPDLRTAQDPHLREMWGAYFPFKMKWLGANVRSIVDRMWARELERRGES